MQVGVYVDGFNLYYGARELCGRRNAGWRWLDIRALVESILPGSWRSRGAALERVVYCTARVSGARDRSSAADQNVYIRALSAHGSVDLVEYGNFVSRVKFAPLAVPNPDTYKPKLVRPSWPLKLQDASGANLSDATMIVSYLHQEEKGSDVNVGTHLLLDVLQETVDAAVVISNDSDLKLPIREARQRVPVGTVNPSPAQLAGALKGSPTGGAGNHWWRQIVPQMIRSNQLPDPVDGLSKPKGW